MPRTAYRPPEYVRAREPATGDFGGVPFVVNPSTVMRASDALVKAFPHLFVPLEAGQPRPAGADDEPVGDVER